ncbi:unnamed protein product [Arabis nemorensis]|uniref:Uncharacterized protein n=1 Tax=Arabis nemorensis TaxID=586526 RepID=A0A565BSY1_9BRAS|nr:unnamed protein product [Arabis nemorensis]
MLGKFSRKLKKIQPPEYVSFEEDLTLSHEEEVPQEVARRSMYDFHERHTEEGGSRVYEEGDDETLRSYIARVSS